MIDEYDEFQEIVGSNKTDNVNKKSKKHTSTVGKSNKNIASAKIDYSKYIKIVFYAILWACLCHWAISTPKKPANIMYTILNIPVSFVAYLIGAACEVYFRSLFGSNALIDKVARFLGPRITAMIIGSMLLYHMMYK